MPICDYFGSGIYVKERTTPHMRIINSEGTPLYKISCVWRDIKRYNKDYIGGEVTSLTCTLVLVVTLITLNNNITN